MALYIQGYDEDRFVTTINRNFLCLICFNVLKDPVMCSRNQHCFCRSCITQHLRNAQRCPTCNDELTVDTLAEPPRMVKEVINELNINCVYNNRGCQEIPQLQHLNRHEDSCGFAPVVCTNEGCGATVNKRDFVHHESEQCEYRKVECHSCGEITMPLTKKKKIANMESKICSVEKSVADIGEAVKNEVKGLKKALAESFDQIKDVLVNMEDRIQENKRKIRNTSRGDEGKIFVAGGAGHGTAEIFNWSEKSWATLQSMPVERFGATVFVHDNHVVTAGGYRNGFVDDMIRMKIDPNPDPSTHWSDYPVKLPDKLAYHSSVVYNDHLYVAGGCIDGFSQISDRIDEVRLVSPYTVKTLSRMPEPRQGHGMEIFDDNFLILGGSTTKYYKDNLGSVVLYDIKKLECKQLASLPYEVSYMATVRWGDNIVMIGGRDKNGNRLNTVIMYNVKTQQSHMLPPMRCERSACTAVVIGNNIVVLGGRDEQGNDLKSVECFNFERYNWEELPEMSTERSCHTAVVA